MGQLRGADDEDNHQLSPSPAQSFTSAGPPNPSPDCVKTRQGGAAALGGGNLSTGMGRNMRSASGILPKWWASRVFTQSLAPADAAAPRVNWPVSVAGVW